MDILIGLVLGIIAFRLCISMDWHWGVGVFVGLVPVAAMFFFGWYGLGLSAIFVGALYKAWSK